MIEKIDILKLTDWHKCMKCFEFIKAKEELLQISYYKLTIKNKIVSIEPIDKTKKYYHLDCAKKSRIAILKSQSLLKKFAEENIKTVITNLYEPKKNKKTKFKFIKDNDN